MTTLSESIEALRLKMVETTEEEKHLVDTLGQRLREADDDIMHALQQIITDQEHRRHDIADLLHTIAARIGHVPRALSRPPPVPRPVSDHDDRDQDVQAIATSLSHRLSQQAGRMADLHDDYPGYVNGTHTH